VRRPAPLPASPEEPHADEVVESAPSIRRGRSPLRFGGSETDAAVASAEVRMPDPVGQDARNLDAHEAEAAEDPSSVTAVIEEGGREGVSAPARTGEVWRAARARRKALRAEIRRFTQRSRRRRFIVWGSIGAVVALVLGSVIAAYSPLFAVEKITVVGAKTIDPVVVQQSLSKQIGAPLALVDADEVRFALGEFPIIESYALEVRPPRELLVRIVERTPIGAIREADGYAVVDAAGVVLSSSPKLPEGRPELEITGGIGSAAFRSAGLVMRSLPADLRATVTTVRATSGDDVTLRLADGKTVVWGSEKDSVLKAAVLVRLIAASPGSSAFDVSSPAVPVVR